MDTVSPLKEGIEFVNERGGASSILCFQCGLCTTACPWNNIKPFIPHKLMRQAQFGLYELENEQWWWCTACRKCEERCPRGVAIPGIQRAVRELATEWQANPSSIRSVASSLATLGNPWQGEKQERTRWAAGRDIPQYTKGMDFFYFPCCTIAYDKRLLGVAQATSTILKRNGISFGILGKESCCGESINKTGNGLVFRDLAKDNIFLFLNSGVQQILVNSPHCYVTLHDEYPAMGGKFEIYHSVQLLFEMLRQGKLKFKHNLDRKVIYHDPCYLGRYANLYDEPRELLKCIPGLELIEFQDNYKNSLCCGGGGGRIWMETKKGERFSDFRLQEAVAKKADILATACPYCLLNFKDSQLSVAGAESLEIKDITELIAELI